jgi:hypothetical protein
MPGDDRRRHPRTSKLAPLILIEKTETDVKEGAILMDVSLGGLAFETSMSIKKGDSFEFALYVPTRGWVDGVGRVCWTKPSGKTTTLCGASIEVQHLDQQKLLAKWLSPSGRGLLRFFFPDKVRNV